MSAMILATALPNVRAPSCQLRLHAERPAPTRHFYGPPVEVKFSVHESAALWTDDQSSPALQQLPAQEWIWAPLFPPDRATDLLLLCLPTNRPKPGPRWPQPRAAVPANTRRLPFAVVSPSLAALFGETLQAGDCRSAKAPEALLIQNQ